MAGKYTLIFVEYIYSSKSAKLVEDEYEIVPADHHHLICILGWGRAMHVPEFVRVCSYPNRENFAQLSLKQASMGAFRYLKNKYIK